MLRIVFLGTGAGVPTLYRNVASTALDLTRLGEGIWLFDCGEGTQHQILKTNITLHKIRRIFITHLHGDHVFGLLGLLTSRSLVQGAPPLRVYGPKGIKAFVENGLEQTHSYMTYDLQVEEIQEGEVYKGERFTVKASELQHRVQCYGYRIEEAERRGRLNIEALQKLGVPAGPILQRIKKGEKVNLPDGRLIDGSAFVGKATPGRVVVCGDSAPCEAAIALAHQADIFIHEATFEAAMHESANERGHSTTVQAAMLAKKSGAKRLILNHLSARYKMSDEERLLQECQAIFPETSFAQDFDCVELP